MVKIKIFLHLLRPQQWIKNLLLLFPPFFGGLITDEDVIIKIFPALLAFCATSSASYIINDIKDIDADRNHKKKKERAIASGNISVSSGIVIAFVLLLIAIAASFSVSSIFWLYLITYLLI